VLRITEAGLQAIGVESAGIPDEASRLAAQEGEGRQDAAAPAGTGREAPVTASVPACGRTGLRQAAIALLASWDTGLERPALPASIEDLRSALVGGRGQGRPPRDPAVPRAPREGTKQQTVLTLLDLLQFSGEALDQLAAILSNWMGLVKSSAEWRLTGL
jgi:hypothetical protein